jgi:hypothetical protein
MSPKLTFGSIVDIFIVTIMIVCKVFSCNMTITDTLYLAAELLSQIFVNCFKYYTCAACTRRKTYF